MYLVIESAGIIFIGGGISGVGSRSWRALSMPWVLSGGLVRIDRRGTVEGVRGDPFLELAFGLSARYNRTATNIEAHKPNDVNAAIVAGSPVKPPIVRFMFCGPVFPFAVISPRFSVASLSARGHVEEFFF